MNRNAKTALLSALVIVCINVSARSETKSFEFGPGTSNAISAKRTFAVPCHKTVGTYITFRRLGDAGTEHDVPVVIEVREPGTSTSEGRIVRSANLTATRLNHTAKFNFIAGSEKGCSVPWVVRIRPASGVSSVVVVGEIYFFDDGIIPYPPIEGGLISLQKGNSVTKNLGDGQGLHVGSMTIVGNWLHSVFGLPGPLPVILKFELIRPDGSVAASDSGYTYKEINPCCSGNKLLVRFFVSEHKAGQWKLRITNNSNEDAMNINPVARILPQCSL